MLTIAWLLIASTVSLQPDTTVVLGLMERDVTGDGEPETLRVVGVAPSDTRDGGEIWEEILKSPATIFTFSPGGDAVVAIGWSARAGRFYRLLECC